MHRHLPPRLLGGQGLCPHRNQLGRRPGLDEGCQYQCHPHEPLQSCPALPGVMRRKGMYILDEIPYCWINDQVKDPAYAPYLLQRATETLARDENRPCVLAWSIGNENPMGPNSQDVMDLVRATDPTRPAFVSCNSPRRERSTLGGRSLSSILGRWMIIRHGTAGQLLRKPAHFLAAGNAEITIRERMICGPKRWAASGAKSGPPPPSSDRSSGNGRTRASRIKCARASPRPVGTG
jgi:hypothetical protein